MVRLKSAIVEHMTTDTNTNTKKEKLRNKHIKLWRAMFLALAAIVGIPLSCLINYLHPHLSFLPEELLHASTFQILIFSLPVIALLWIFRTHDTREQIQETRENTNTQIFFNAKEDLLYRKDDTPQGNNNTQQNAVGQEHLRSSIGLMQLLALRKRGLFLKEISLLLKNGGLGGALLMETYLEGANLQEVHLENAYLEWAHLQGAHLEGAHLERLILKGLICKGLIWKGLIWRELVC